MADGTPQGFTFADKPSPEVSSYLSEKSLRPAFRYSEVWGQEHAHAFTVAKAVQADVLETLKEAVQYAIDKGIPYETWARDLKPELERLGWWGQADMADPATGEVRPRELGSPRRLRTIYDANLRSARAAGQWERGQRTKAVLPFYLYQLGPSVRRRPEHAAREGMIRPVDDPVWLTWFPPNGWGCKCWLRQITRSEAERRGISEPFEAPLMDWKRRRDDGSTEVVKVPVGIDPGWASNPGVSRAQTLMANFTDRLEKVGEKSARALMTGFWSGSTPAALTGFGQRVFAPAAIAPTRLREELDSPAAVVMVSADTMAAKVDKHGKGDRRTRPEDFGRVQRILDDGQLVERRGNTAAYIWGDADGWWLASVKATAKGEIILTSLYPIGERRMRKLSG